MLNSGRVGLWSRVASPQSLALAGKAVYRRALSRVSLGSAWSHLAIRR